MNGTPTPLSLNEVRFFFTRAAVGAGAPFGIGEDFANASIWLACAGADPAQLAAPALKRLADGASCGRLSISSGSEGVHLACAEGEVASAIFAGPAVADWLAVELAKRKITVNCVAPGLIDTDMLDEDVPVEEILKAIPAQRMGTPEEVAAALQFLLSPDAGYITRQVLAVNGGLC